jgi:hypothetical protein
VFYVGQMKRLLALCLLPLVAGVSGCSVGEKLTSGDTQLIVTQDFGRRPLIQSEHPKVGGSDTVLSMLARNARVVTGSGGKTVRSINGVAGPWAFYVNGVTPDDKPGDVDLQGGDVVWWDRRPSGTAATEAVAGSFPEPFRHGPDGKRLPVRIECSPVNTSACAAVEKRLVGAGVLAARGGVAQSFTKHTLRVLVGPYIQLRDDHAVRQLEAGPQVSGVYARPSADGRRLAVLNARGATTETLGPGTGLVAATRYADDQPVWVVTGTNQAGVDAAVQTFDQGDLLNRFAVAVTAGRAIALPG